MGNRYAYTDEFRWEAVELARSSDRLRYKIAESFGVCDGALVSWITQVEHDVEPGALSRDERAELVGLGRQLAEVTGEREVLRRAA